MSFFGDFFKKLKIKQLSQTKQQSFMSSSEVKSITDLLDCSNNSLAPLLNYKVSSKYKNTFDYLHGDFWNSYVPASGQSEVLQAEMMRRIVKLEDEAIRNGNINWDSNFEYFCDFLFTHYSSFTELTNHLDTIELILIKLRYHGKYANLIQMEELPEELWDVKYIAYTDDSLYNYLYEMVCIIYTAHPALIPFEKEDEIYR